LNRKCLHAIVKYTAVFAGALFLLWMLLFMSASIPNESIRKNMEQSALSYKERGAYEFTKDYRLNSVADHYADSIWLNVAWNMGEGNPLLSSIQTDYYDGDELGENAGLYRTVAEGVAPNTDYTRYWHGTAMFIRFLHLFTDVEGVKIIGFCTFLILLILSMFLLAKKKHWDLAVILAVSLAAVQIWNIRLSVEYQPAFILAFILIPLYLIFEQRSDEWLAVISVIGGTSVAFFDFLTTETVTILLPLMLVVAVRVKENRLKDTNKALILLIKCCVCWACAYVGAFVTKWLVAGIVTESDVLSLALSSVAERMGSNVELYIDQPDSIFSSIAANLSMLFGSEIRVQTGKTIVGILIFALILLSCWYLFRGKEKKGIPSIMLIGLGLTVLVRYLLLNNHSYLHCMFTYRALASTVFALIMAMWLNLELPYKKRGRK